ncbi:bifunctional alpha,alpha-trehalose-phosphate synthase (UDP-forming)/trehalose-phosphatase [Candidatus Daviesbacteria bacterium]|nr:bifunctional alpha,alpha-trehalose-phosphate synthase (UDP-forming)/trehalose-phosphatase [Candidatus Daviesbacteria bacterium]
MRYLIVSNRLPFTVTQTDKKLEFKNSSGGLVSSINSFFDHGKKTSSSTDYLWIGWPGNLSADAFKQLKPKFKSKKSLPISLPTETFENFYEGFCNKIIWPLFHYFPTYTVFNVKYWKEYEKVNQIFADEILKILKPADVIWIHDYHLMLLPNLIRQKSPDVKIGFFLHIPFPSYEVFRLLPSKWRISLLKGILGADLVGFHTFDYTQYFYRCMLRILGYEHSFGKVSVGDRVVRIETFPLGIDYQKFSSASSDREIKKQKRKLIQNFAHKKIILSLDRLDYTKGVINRLKAYELFLEKNPRWLKKVVLVLVTIPSRTEVEQYQIMKQQIEELVSNINGHFASLDWTPISYQYKSLNFKELIALYGISDVALVTPLRDGMNLIAKEYIASKQEDEDAVLILSEMAGSSKELTEAILVNPNSKEEIAEAIKQALDMPRRDQKKHLDKMQDHLQKFDVVKWGEDFMKTLDLVKLEQFKLKNKFSLSSVHKKLLTDFYGAKRRLILLDYDGTLVPYFKRPNLAKPSREVLKLLKEIINEKRNELVLFSGRDRKVMFEWFGKLNIGFVGEHGLLFKEKWVDWKLIKPLNTSWKSKATSILQLYVDQLPGSFIEEKEHSLAWHYRLSDPELASVKTKELIDDLVSFISNTDLQILHGSKVIELKNSTVNKGTAAAQFLNRENFDFILSIGDDGTDEDVFLNLPEQAYSIKVGTGQTNAKFQVSNHQKVVELLKELVKIG